MPQKGKFGGQKLIKANQIENVNPFQLIRVKPDIKRNKDEIKESHGAQQGMI